MTKVTILLTSYNHGKFIKKTIDSILNQTFKDFELIIVDDCSTDNSVEIIKSYKDIRIKTFFHKKNIGYCMTRELVESFNGEYFAIAHSDDIWNENKLQKQVDYLDSHKNIAACFTWVKLINEEDNELESKDYINFNLSFKNRFEILNHFFYSGNFLCHPSVLMRKNIQLEENLFVKGLGALPDFYRWTKLSLKYDICILEEKLTYFRVRENGANTSGLNKKNMTRFYFDLIPILELYKQIDSKEDFLKIFPSAKKYFTKNDIEISFALARICIDEQELEPYKLFGLKLIFDLLQDSDKLKKIENLYNYTSKDFKNETGNNDIFKKINDIDFMNCSIYLKDKKGYSEENKISETVFIKNKKFKILFDDLNLETTNLRIDFNQKCFRKFKDIKIYINEKENKNIVFKGSVVKQKWMYFFTLNPKIYISNKEIINSISIISETELISNEELENRTQYGIIGRVLKKIYYIFTKITKKGV